jgi:hypothetical protein
MSLGSLLGGAVGSCCKRLVDSVLRDGGGDETIAARREPFIEPQAHLSYR